MAQVRYRHIPKLPEGAERWICIYPAYVNKDRTVAEGRRIPRNKAVPSPTCKEIIETLSNTGLQVYGENKVYCREKSKEPQNWGRVRVQIKNGDEIINPKFKNRKDVFLYVGENVSKLKSRTNPKPQPTQAPQPPAKQGKGKRRK